MNERRQDFEWLQRFARQGEQSAFADLVRRHLDLVYCTALRKLEAPEAAQEVAQNVFATLARKAWRFAPDDSLPAWLHKAALLEAKIWLRGELRRRRREETAAELGTTMNAPEDQPAGNALVPLLDEALLSLREKDRTALLLRFYENQSLREVGAALGTSDDTAQKRVQSALEKLSGYFKRRGFKTATVAAATAALQQTSASASAATVSVVIGAALQVAPPTLAGGALLLARFASLSKVQTVLACLALAAVPGTWQWQKQQARRAEAAQIQTRLAAAQTEQASLQTELARLQAVTSRLEKERQVEIATAQQAAQAAERYDAWKNRLRGQLLAKDYRWPEDSPFVRIPKSALTWLEFKDPISRPGTIAPVGREFLGLTPAERQKLETLFHEHIATMDQLTNNRLYETNRASHWTGPDNALARQVFASPALGDEAQARVDQTKAALKDLLGSRMRWVNAALDAAGTGTPRDILNLDLPTDGQEMVVWITDRGSGPVVGWSWAVGKLNATSDGLTLARFLDTSEAALAANKEARFILHDLPAPIRSRMLAWLEQQAHQRLQ